MAPLQGHNLGQKHIHYNKLLKEAMSLNPVDLSRINYEATDVDNMIKIDVACSTRNVEYILNVLKGDDLLYVSRVIKQSSWLITETKYADIINPNYLHKELFPYMNAKAVSKLMLLIRLHLKDESRVRAFYWYVLQKNRKQAWRWLQNCPIKLINSRYNLHIDEIPVKNAVRLCDRGFYLAIFKKMGCVQYLFDGEYKHARRLFKTHTDQYLDKVRYYGKFNKKRTTFLMNNYRQRVMDNYWQYEDQIHTDTFFKYLKADEIIPYCLDMAKTNKISWNYYNLKPFLRRIPREDVIDFLKKLLAIKGGTWVEPDTEKDESKLNISTTADLEENVKNSEKKERGDVEELFYAFEGERNKEFSNVYRWYEYIPFELAFPDIKRFVFTESVPEERLALLIVLLNCSYYNFDHVMMTVKYYHDKHINEPYLHKIKFVENVIYWHSAFRFDEADWEIVNNLFKSLEVYIESTNKVQQCVICVILYNITRDQPVHEVVEEKFLLESLVHIKPILNYQEQEKLFDYLYKLHMNRLLSQRTDSETGLREAVELLKKLWTLLKDWEKLETHSQLVIDKVSEYGEINRYSKWNETVKKRRLYRRKLKPRRRFYDYEMSNAPKPYINMPEIYNMVKQYKRKLFEKSLILNTSEEVCLNALRHDAGLLERYNTEVEDLLLDNRMPLKRFLRKLRIYWPESLAMQCAKTSKEKLLNKTGHKSLIRGLMVILSQKEVLDLIQKFAPVDKKIEWLENKDIEISIQKNIAKCMHLVRPTLPINVIMIYAKGDYLQFSLRSLLSAYSTLRSKDINAFIEILLNTPVSIQKHGIRLAFAKWKVDKLITRSESLWKSNRNATIRLLIFTSILDLLCKEKKSPLLKKLWSLLSSFINELGNEENKDIYYAMGRKIRDIPRLVIGEYIPQVYWFLKALEPRDETVNLLLNDIFSYTGDIVEYLDDDFIEKMLMYDLNGYNEGILAVTYRDRSYLKVLTNYLLHTKDLDVQMRKYNKLLRPVLESCVSHWKNGNGTKCKEGWANFLTHICKGIPHFVIEKKMVMPLEIVTQIKIAIAEFIHPIERYYTLITRWIIEHAYLEIMTSIINSKTEIYTWDQIRFESTNALGELCLRHLFCDIEKFFPSIHLIFKDSLLCLFSDFNIEEYNKFQVLDKMLDYKDEIVYMFVLNMMPSSSTKYENKFDVIMSKIYNYPSMEINLHYVQWFSKTYTGIVQDNEEILSAEISTKVEIAEESWD